jgi:hypothetical protein
LDRFFCCSAVFIKTLTTLFIDLLLNLQTF